MVGKTRIISELGESSLLLPEYVNQALAANERLKYYFSLLQTARAHAERPQEQHPDLAFERTASGIEDASLDQVIEQSRKTDGGAYRIPEAERVFRLVREDMDVLLAPLAAAEPQAEDARELAACRQRLEAVLAALPPPTDGQVTGAFIDALTRARRGADAGRGADSLHLLVMDVHKVLNRLQARLSQESIDGALVYNIDPGDHRVVKAFMSGLNTTAPLKFDHPGLGTTATRVGDRLVIQNDIGTTDAHVLVAHVEGLATVLTYTDVHIRRAAFFQSLFERFAVAWEDTRSRQAAGLEEGPGFYLCSGRFEARDDAELERYLGFVGSRIVFLIDWNRARKRLRNFVKTRDAIAVLKWAADHDFGHRAFLELGAEQLVFDAAEHATRAPMRRGERLDKLLGHDTLVAYLEFVLRTAAEGLLAGRSARLIRDEIQAELAAHIQSTKDEFLELAAAHAGLIADLAGAVRDALLRAPNDGAEELLERTSRRAKHWETRADDLLIRIREMIDVAGGKLYAPVVAEADDAADGLEEAAFLLTLLPTVRPAATHYGSLQALAELLVAGTHEFVKCLESAAAVVRGGSREDLHDFLEAVDRVARTEHQTDESEREVTVALLRGGADVRQLHLGSQIAASLEQSADALSRSAFMLRDVIMHEVMVR